MTSYSSTGSQCYFYPATVWPYAVGIHQMTYCQFGYHSPLLLFAYTDKYLRLNEVFGIAMLFLYDSAGAMRPVREATVHKAAALNGFPSGPLQAKASLSTDRIFIAHASARYP